MNFSFNEIGEESAPSWDGPILLLQPSGSIVVTSWADLLQVLSEQSATNRPTRSVTVINLQGRLTQFPTG